MIDGYADAHLHLADMALPNLGCVDRASLMLSCTSSHHQWELQERIAAADKRVIPFYGTHPWYCADLPYGHLDLLTEYLERNRRSGVGEIGLEGKRRCDPSQNKVFAEQLTLANELDRVAVIHMTGTEEGVLREIRANRGVRTILHSYSGPGGYVDPFLDAGCYFSLSPRLLRSEKRVEALLMALPMEKILIESDAPSGVERVGMDEFIAKLSAMMDVTAEDLIEFTKENTLKAIS